MRSLAAIIILAMGSLSTSLWALSMRTIDMDNSKARILPQGKRPNVGPPLQDRSDTVSTTYDTDTRYSIWRDDHGFRGPHSLGMRIEREVRESSPKSKIELNLARHDDYRLDSINGHRFILRNSSERYVGFAMKLGAKYENPLRWLLHFQVWQCCAATQPPLTLQALASDGTGPLNFVLLRRDNRNLRRPKLPDNGTRILLKNGEDQFTLERDRWYRFVFRLRPGRDSRAGVTVWLDGKEFAVFKGPWGYTTAGDPDLTNRYAIKLGIYRHANPSMQEVFFDSIRWGLSRRDVDPDQN